MAGLLPIQLTGGFRRGAEAGRAAPRLAHRNLSHLAALRALDMRLKPPIGPSAPSVQCVVMVLHFKTVLIVDDVPLERRLLSNYLRERGFEVLQAATGEEAIGTLATGQRVDIVLSDIHLDGEFDGYALARWVRDHRPGVWTVLGTSRGGMAREAAEICATVDDS